VPSWHSAKPRLRSTLTGSASRCLGRSLAVMAPGAAHTASAIGSTRTAALSTSSILITARRSIAARNGDRHTFDGWRVLMNGGDQLFAADAFVLGRQTYQGLARVWPTITDDRGFADRVNALPKFVASRTLTEPLKWNATLIKGDVAEGVRELKRQHSGHLLPYGCGELARYLTAHGLVDEIRFTVFPTVLGEGVRPFGGSGPPVNLRLTGTMFRSGVALLTYRPEVA
jgi:dihydrofolate reductase